MALLELNGITRLFGKLAAVEDIDLQVQKGEILGVVLGLTAPERQR